MKPDPIERLGHPGGLAGPEEVPRRWPRFAAAMLVVAVLAGIGGYVYESLTRQDPITSREVPLIKADASPTKKRPDDHVANGDEGACPLRHFDRFALAQKLDQLA